MSTYRMPAEWEPHDAVWLQWPDRSMAGQHQMKLEATWLAMVAAMAGSVPVRAVVASDASAERLQSQLSWFGLSDAVEPVVIPIDDVWARDSGPVFVLDGAGSLNVTDWNFNGWGGRFEHPARSGCGRGDRGVARCAASQAFDEPGGRGARGERDRIAYRDRELDRERQSQPGDDPVGHRRRSRPLPRSSRTSSGSPARRRTSAMRSATSPIGTSTSQLGSPTDPRCSIAGPRTRRSPISLPGATPRATPGGHR